MPTLESFLIDHTKIKSPSVRKVKVLKTIKEDKVYVFDLRFCTPNLEKMPEKGIHTLEHLFSNFMRNYIDNDCKYNFRKIVDISPMGCRTGFYLIIISNFKKENENYYNLIMRSWENSMLDILNIKGNNISSANIYQCGSYLLHSLSEAKEIAKKILSKKIVILKNKNLILKNSKIITN